MKVNDKETLSIAATVSDVLEGKIKKEEVKYPHMMYSPEGEEVEVKTKEEHEKYAKKGYTHDKPEVDEVAEPEPKGEKEFKDKHVIKKSGAKKDGSIVKEAKKEEPEVEEESDKQKKYRAFFDKALKKFGVSSPAELEGDKKKEFFDYVDKNYEADSEED